LSALNRVHTLITNQYPENETILNGIREAGVEVIKI